MTNPLLQDWTGPFGIAPYDQIEDAHFSPAIEQAMASHIAEIDAIAQNSDAPSFENTIEALEGAGEDLDKALSVLFNLMGADTNPARQELEREWSPKLSAHSSAIYSNKALFQRIADLWEAHQSLGLDEEQLQVLKLTHRRLVRAGAGLTGAEADRMAEIKSKLAVLSTDFTQNMLKDESDWSMDLPVADQDGLPDWLISAATAAGETAGKDGPIVTLSRSLVVPFLQYSTRRDLREIAYKAWTARGANGGETDNRAIATEILKLRHERAELLGYADFASYKLETEMAKTADNVRELLETVWEPTKQRANADAEILERMMHSEGVNGRLEPWDWHHYAEKRRQVEHDLDEAALKPFFQLDRMIEAAFDCATKLFGLQFKELDLPLYHPDCRAFEVSRGGQHLAVFIGDYFARPSKRSGAWCSALRTQSKRPRDNRPIVFNVCNFAKPAEGEPALLSYDDARTLFHEFGHALHQMLSNVTYGSIAGTNVARDFVELPSQLYEHWLEVPEVLAEFATHAETGEAMPKEMLEKVLGAANFDTGFQTAEFVASAMVDLEFHIGSAPDDAMETQARVLKDMGMPHAIAMRHATPHFAHVFAGDGYASGYYSYMWSEVMDADAFEAFKEVGDAFDADLAKSLETNILSAGGSKEGEELYRAFRGRLPEADALLKGRGLIP